MKLFVMDIDVRMLFPKPSKERIILFLRVFVTKEKSNSTKDKREKERNSHKTSNFLFSFRAKYMLRRK